MLTIAFRTDNAAFDQDVRAEAARLLRRVAERLEVGADEGACIDANGNGVGAWSLADHRDMEDSDDGR